MADLFTRSGGYNDFILHYANLMQGKVDGFAIGSELIGLTKVHDGASVNRTFPAVDALVNLAASAKGVLGAAFHGLRSSDRVNGYARHRAQAATCLDAVPMQKSGARPIVMELGGGAWKVLDWALDERHW